MKGLYRLNEKFGAVGLENCFISEITLAELKFGVENSSKPTENQKNLDLFLSGLQILPIIEAIDIYAKEKSRLRKKGISVDDFDLLIGATSVAYNLKMVTNNIRHFNQITGISIEDWTI